MWWFYPAGELSSTTATPLTSLLKGKGEKIGWEGLRGKDKDREVTHQLLSLAKRTQSSESNVTCLIPLGRSWTR